MMMNLQTETWHAVINAIHTLTRISHTNCCQNTTSNVHAYIHKYKYIQ